MNKKNCFYCGSKVVRKSGLCKGKQRYKCAVCGKRFIDKVSNLVNGCLQQQLKK